MSTDTSEKSLETLIMRHMMNQETLSIVSVGGPFPGDDLRLPTSFVPPERRWRYRSILLLLIGLFTGSCMFLPGKNELIEFMEVRHAHSGPGIRTDGYYWARKSLLANGERCRAIFPIIFLPSNYVRIFGNFVPKDCGTKSDSQAVKDSHELFRQHLDLTGFLEGKSSGLYRWGRYRLDLDSLRMKYLESGGGFLVTASFFVDGLSGVRMPMGPSKSTAIYSDSRSWILPKRR